MWLVALALRRPHTSIVGALLILLLSLVTLARIGTDLLPVINTPVVAVVFTYTGMPPEEMDKRVITNFERLLTAGVTGIDRIESQCISGMGIVRVFLHPGTNVDTALGQVNGISSFAVRGMPPGMTAPLVTNYDAGNVPVLLVSLSSETLSEQEIYDLGNNTIRNALATVQGAKINNPIGGKQRGIIIDLDPARLAAYGLDADAVTLALNRQNLNLPAGSLPLGGRDYPIRLNSSPTAIADFNDVPIAERAGVTIRIRDVGEVRDGFQPQTTLAHVDGRRGVIQLVRKLSGASTLDIAERVRLGLAKAVTTVPEALRVELLADQSGFVRAAIHGVVVEGLVAGGLTALFILAVLGSWRSTLVVVASIPLSILAAVTVLGALGFTINLMTLGGLALAVGILVDDATVEIENIHRNLARQRAQGALDLREAILTGARQIAVPTLVATLCIMIVFLPVAFLAEPIRSLFVPMAVAVVAALGTSYLLSRTLVPTLVQALLPGELAGSGPRGVLGFVHRGAEGGFLRLRSVYGAVLARLQQHRVTVLLSFALVLGSAAWIASDLGRDLFPVVDAGQIRLHVRSPPGTRLEEAERRVSAVGDTIRRIIPPGELVHVVDIQGGPSSPFNAPLYDPSLISPADAEVQIYLARHHTPVADLIPRLRAALAEDHPDLSIFLKPADIPSQVLTFGQSAPLVIQFTGPPAVQAANLTLARRLVADLAQVPGAVDVRLAQITGVPELRVDVDRTLAAHDGLTQADVANATLTALASSNQLSPGFWFDPAKGLQYGVTVRQPPWRLERLQDLRELPVEDRRLSDVATIRRASTVGNTTHTNVNTTIDVLAAAEGVDLGRLTDAAQALVDRVTPDLPRGSSIRVRGAAEQMRASFAAIGWGLAVAVALVYLLLVLNLHSWVEPAIVLVATAGSLAGVVLALHVTGTPASIPALLGSILGAGVATANSILVVTFAAEARGQGADGVLAAWQAGTTRLRPVLMTAGAMIIGMVPLALGLSEGGEQNAPLGRAVIGALVAATATTLLVVPVILSWRRSLPDTAP